MAIRRGRIDQEFRRAALADLALLEIETDPHTDRRAWPRRSFWRTATG